MDIKQIEILLGVVAFIASTILGFSIYLKQKDSATNKIFLLLSLLIDWYIVVNYISLHPPGGGASAQLFWIRVVMFVCSFIGPFLVLLVHTFPGTQITLSLKKRIALFSLMALSAVLALSPYVFTSIQYPNGQPVPVPGPGIIVFFLDFVGLFILSFIILAYKYRHAIGVDKIKLWYFLIGVLVSFSLMGVTTVVCVAILKVSSLVFLGPIFTVILMACIAYAIVKYNLFAFKVLGSEALIFAIWIALFARAITDVDLSEKLISFGILTAVTVLGNFLVKSVKREVGQREQLENLTSDLKKANDKLTALDKARSEFISIASHQLRTPPTTIKWYLAALLSGDYGPISTQVRERLAKAEVINNSQIYSIEDLLNASRIERGKMEFLFEPTDLVEVTKIAVDQIMPQAVIKKLHLQYVPPKKPVPLVMADKEKLKQVISNMIDNAIKYTPQGEITASVYAKGDDVYVAVKDTGKGIASDQIKMLFQKYNRGKDSAMQATGLGLGLYVAKVVIKQHKGKIWVESPGEGKGSTFIFSIPIHSGVKETTILDLTKDQ